MVAQAETLPGIAIRRGAGEVSAGVAGAGMGDGTAGSSALRASE